MRNRIPGCLVLLLKKGTLLYWRILHASCDYSGQPRLEAGEPRTEFPVHRETRMLIIDYRSS
jgi:hypothetical protein